VLFGYGVWGCSWDLPTVLSFLTCSVILICVLWFILLELVLVHTHIVHGATFQLFRSINPRQQLILSSYPYEYLIVFFSTNGLYNVVSPSIIRLYPNKLTEQFFDKSTLIVIFSKAVTTPIIQS
jgi:hypothetical protein